MSEITPYTTPDTKPRYTRVETSRLSEIFINKINMTQKHKQ